MPIAMLVAALTAIIGGGILVHYLTATNNAATSASAYSNIYTGVLDDLTNQGVDPTTAAQTAQKAADSAANVAQASQGFHFSLTGITIPVLAIAGAWVYNNMHKKGN